MIIPYFYHLYDVFLYCCITLFFSLKKLALFENGRILTSKTRILQKMHLVLSQSNILIWMNFFSFIFFFFMNSKIIIKTSLFVLIRIIFSQKRKKNEEQMKMSVKFDANFSERLRCIRLHSLGTEQRKMMMQKIL